MVARHLHHIVYPFKALLFRGVTREVHLEALTPSARRLGACAGLLLLAILSTSPVFANPGANQRQYSYGGNDEVIYVHIGNRVFVPSRFMW